MAARHDIALAMYAKGVPLRDLAINLILSVDEAEEEGVDPATDAAVLLIGHQLAFLTHADSMPSRMVRDLIRICESNQSTPVDPMFSRSH